MIVFRYDKTFEGLLTALFDAYFRKTFPEVLVGVKEPLPMFATEEFTVITDADKSARVWGGVEKKIDRNSRNMIMHVWFSECDRSDMLILKLLRKIFDSTQPVMKNYGDPDVLECLEIARRVSKDHHRIRQFLRFQKAADGTYFAAVRPDHNSLPFAIGYLRDRFADQPWLVYDMKRDYGFYYDLDQVREVTLAEEGNIPEGRLDPSIMDTDELLFQNLWKNYFRSMAIKERLNPKLHRQNMPRRFWKYLTEKQ